MSELKMMASTSQLIAGMATQEVERLMKRGIEEMNEGGMEVTQSKDHVQVMWADVSEQTTKDQIGCWHLHQATMTIVVPINCLQIY
jgi:hypothetical protein